MLGPKTEIPLSSASRAAVHSLQQIENLLRDSSISSWAEAFAIGEGVRRLERDGFGRRTVAP